MQPINVCAPLWGAIGGSGNQVSYGFHGEADDIPLSTTLTPQMWVQAFWRLGEVGSTANTARITASEQRFPGWYGC